MEMLGPSRGPNDGTDPRQSVLVVQAELQELQQRLAAAENARLTAEQAAHDANVRADQTALNVQRMVDEAVRTSLAAHSTTAPTPVGSEPPRTATERKTDSFPKPEAFNGDRKKYNTWRYKMRNKLAKDRSHESTVYQQQYVVAFLTDTAGDFIGHYASRIDSGQLPNEQFWAILDGRFRDTHLAQRAEIALDQLKQGSKPFVEFAVEFEKLWTEAGRDPDGPEKVRQFEKKLSSELRQLAVTGIPVVPVHFEDFANQLHNLDTRLQSATIDGAFRFLVNRSRIDPNSTTRKGAQDVAPPRQPRTVADDPDAMELDGDLRAPRVNRFQSSGQKNVVKTRPLLPETARNPTQTELVARKEKKCCLNCGNKGHFSRQCPWASHGIRLNAVAIRHATAVPHLGGYR